MEDWEIQLQIDNVRAYLEMFINAKSNLKKATSSSSVDLPPEIHRILYGEIHQTDDWGSSGNEM